LRKIDIVISVLALGPLLMCTPVELDAQGQENPHQENPQQENPQQDGSASGEFLPSPEDFGLRPGRPRVSPTRTDSPPVIDGILDDEVWRSAAHITEFTQQQPLDGAPASEETDVYIAYDSEHIYFGFHAHYSDPSIMRANRVERDRAMMDDLMTIYFDTFLQQQRGYDFDVNGYGVQGDGVMTVGGRRGGRGGGGGGGPIPSADRSWNALFDTGAQIVEDGYTAEMAIPFKSLRYPTPPEGEPHRWGFQIVREVKGKDSENQVWAPMSRDETSFFAQMGLLEGMTDLSSSKNLEIQPTFTAIQYGQIDPTQLAYVNQGADPDAGVNVKYGITSDITADLTINPDFSQIESDRPQIVINQRDPLFFSELRPFFVEGSEIFSITGPVTFVHTRTIVDPDYGAKVSGQVGRFAVGALTANDRAPGLVDDPNDRASGRSAQTFIGRVKYDLGSESTLGAIFTDREFLDGYSRVFGLNSDFRVNSSISGDFTAVRSSHKGVGSSQEGGNMLSTRVVQNGRRVGWSVFAYQVSPEFQTDVGFVRRRDQRNVGTSLSYRFWPESWMINWGPSLNYSRNYNFDGVLQDESARLFMNLQFARSINLHGGYNLDMERWEGFDYQKQGFFVRGRVNTSRTFSFGANLSMGDEIFYSAPLLGYQVNWGLNGSVRPTDAWETTLNFTHRRLTDPAAADAELFDVKIIRAQTTFQFTPRLGLRNITEWNTEGHTFALNFLFNYRVNAGTVVYLGYDDHYQQANLIEGDIAGDGYLEQLYFTQGLKRTNRAIFVKFQYLFRY
jgi:hypothetical protein